jgi:hypothetical protein
VLDHGIEGERRAGFALALRAVACVYDEGKGEEGVADVCAEAAAAEGWGWR